MVDSNDLFNDADVKQSRFNNTLAKLIRIDNIRHHMFDARLSENYWKQIKCLLTLRSELNQLMNNAERLEVDKLEKLLYDFLNRRGKFNRGYVRNSLIPAIDLYERKLNDIEQKYGLGVKYNNNQGDTYD